MHLVNSIVEAGTATAVCASVLFRAPASSQRLPNLISIPVASALPQAAKAARAPAAGGRAALEE